MATATTTGIATAHDSNRPQVARTLTREFVAAFAALGLKPFRKEPLQRPSGRASGGPSADGSGGMLKLAMAVYCGKLSRIFAPTRASSGFSGEFCVNSNDLDRRQSSSATGNGSMLTPAHHEASSP